MFDALLWPNLVMWEANAKSHRRIDEYVIARYKHVMSYAEMI